MMEPSGARGDRDGGRPVAGVSVAGKTGTAETRRPQPQPAWFIGFAPVDGTLVAVVAS